MKNWIALACIAILVGGCATRPATGPGSGLGASYVPVVASPTQAPEVYAADVAVCQREANGYPFIRPTEHEDALLFVNTLTLGSVIAATGTVHLVPLIAGTTTAGGFLTGWDYFVYSPQRAVWRTKQETVLMNCMARRGYENADPSVKVTWRSPLLNPDLTFRRTGVDTYNAEKLAKANSCAALPLASLVDKGPGFERYTLACNGGRTMAVRCEFGNCRAG